MRLVRKEGRSINVVATKLGLSWAALGEWVKQSEVGGRPGGFRLEGEVGCRHGLE